MDPHQGPPQPDPLIGQTIGNYLVTQKLGEGGMGSVYLAEHPTIGKKVALKVLHAEFSNNEEVAKRFFHEAKAVNNIGHPNIVDIVDYGVLQSGVSGREHLVYFIMEYLQGNTLSHVIRAEAPLPPERALQIALQTADALGASHKCGIVHRDLKPDNIILIQRGRDHDFVKLLDFGIAKLTGDTHGAQRTRTGIVMGTPAYMSPEQCEGRANVDERTDIYALGIVLYEMLTGRVPFIGEGYGEILVQHLTQHPIPPSQYRILPAHVEVVVLKALEKRPDMRYPTMDEFMRAMSDPVGYVEAHGGPGQFLQRQLMPSTAPIGPIVRLTPAPYTPVPGTLSPPSGIYAGTPAPTTLGAAAGEVQPRRGKAGFLIAAFVILAGAGVAVAIVATGKKVDTIEAGSAGSATDPGGNDVVELGSGSDRTVGSGSAGSGSDQPGSAAVGSDSGSAVAGSNAGSATPEVGSAGSAAGSAEVVPEVAKITLVTKPAGASIFVDGVDTKKKTPQPIEIPRSKGTVTIKLKLDKYEDVVMENLGVGQDFSKELPLTKKKSTVTVPGRGSGKGSGKGSGFKDNDGLERPD